MRFSPIPSDIFDRVEYDPETGQFTHKVRSCNRLPAGSPAGGQGGHGYVKVRVGGTRYAAHRLAWFWKTRQPVDFEIDHSNGNRSDNRIANLRPASHPENQWNSGARVGSAKGVSFSSASGKFVASIMANGKRTYLGAFDTEAEAKAAYIGAARICHGEFARTE